MAIVAFQAANSAVLAGPQYPTTRDNFDGSVWTYDVPSSDPTLGPLVVDEGRRVADAAQRAYDTMVGSSSCSASGNPSPNWGLRAVDTDCVMQIHAVETQCAFYRGNFSHIRIGFLPAYRGCVALTNTYTNPLLDPDRVALAIVGHEVFHGLQFSVQGVPSWNAMIEGQARFAQALLAPEVESDPSSLWNFGNNGNGVGFFMHSPDVAMCSHQYSYGLYWGFLYDRNGGADGGVAVLRRVLEESVGGSHASCNAQLAQAITDALASLPGDHDSHAQALGDFALALYQKDFSWASPGGSNETHFGAHLEDVKRYRQGIGNVSRSVGSWGLQFVNVTEEGSLTVTVSRTDDGWTHRLFLKADDGSVTVLPLSPGVPVSVVGNQHAEVVVQTVRQAPQGGTYSIEVAA